LYLLELTVCLFICRSPDLSSLLESSLVIPEQWLSVRGPKRRGGCALRAIRRDGVHFDGAFYRGPLRLPLYLRPSTEHVTQAFPAKIMPAITAAFGEKSCNIRRNK
jgi:hypothetical protein